MTQEIKKGFEKQKISLSSLKNKWNYIEPFNNLKNISGKEIIIYNSKKDIVVPYERSVNLIKEMKRIGLNPKVFTNKNLGHHLTVLKFYLSKKEFKRLIK